MAATYFKVVTDHVEALGQKIDDVSNRFDIVANDRVSYSGYADASDMDDGLHDFFSNWTDAMHQIHDDLEHLAEKLHAAASDYQDTEDQIVQAATPSS